MCKSNVYISDNIDPNLSLYRYMSLAQFLSIVENNKIFMNKVKSWEDPWEGPDDQIPVQLENEKIEQHDSFLTATTVGQCWTYEKDSDAMWRIYSPDRQGIMIETNIESFGGVRNLREAVLAKVIYYNRDNYIEKRNEISENKSYRYAGDMALKREAFKHENEVRLLVCLQAYGDIKEALKTSSMSFDLNPLSFIKSITFDPRADDWYVNTMKLYCASKGFKCPIEKSSLYEKDFFKKLRLVKRYETIEGDCHGKRN